MDQLVGMHFSPWTERARWALDYHRLPYVFREYVSLIGEPWLRWKTGDFRSRVTVPLLITPAGVIRDSWQIVLFADQSAPRERALLPLAREREIRHWVDTAETALRAARIRATRRIQQSAGALAERLPSAIPGPLRKPLIPLSWVGSAFILGKYAVREDDDALLADIDVFLAAADRVLREQPFVLGEFSFADLVVATMLQAVAPVDACYIDLGPVSTQVMRETELEARYPRLLAWRDALYAQYR